MFEYFTYFIVTFILSTVFATAGLGSAVALVPVLNMMGIGFDVSRASGLFVNSVSTITASIISLKKGFFDIKFVAVLVLSSVVFAYMGSKISLSLDVETVKAVFGYSLIVIATMTLFFKKKQKKQNNSHNIAVLLIAGSLGGFFSGFLGIGGGSIIAPLLFLFGYDPKKVALGISFVIPFSSLSGFITYASALSLDIMFLFVVGCAAYLGGMMGSYLLHFKVSSNTIKRILAIALYILGFKIVLFG
ncbi:MAG: sulfite exporter TauE/SafE family protein [Campylobacterota bacterium]|nr:sulfite exporter TauE/SafE family protein [Campylobacterota bacterium]